MLKEMFVVCAGTDGLFDNVFPDDASRIVAQSVASGGSPEEVSKVLGQFARVKAGDSKYISPFAYGAFQAGLHYVGGKMDDITVLVAFVTAADEAAGKGDAQQQRVQSKL